MGSFQKKDLRQDHNENDWDLRCGIGSWKPNWLQKVAGPKSFAFFFCVLGFLQGAYFTYFIGILSTIEKRYSYESKISGIILIADNISPIFTSTIMGYYSRRANRARWVAWGMIFVVFANYLPVIPYLIYGSASHLSSASILNLPKVNQVCSKLTSSDHCEFTDNSSTIVAIVFFFIGSFLKGFGSTAFYTIGVPYIDDNIKKKDSPLYFALIWSLRLFGPASGFLLSSFCLRYYEDLTVDPGITSKDPKWVGAWWLGFAILGTLILLFTIPLFLFPTHISASHKKKSEEDNKEIKMKNLPKEVARLVRNPLLMLHTLAGIFNMNGYLGYFIVMPRYMEAQFKQSASDASLYSGPISIVGMQIGIFLGGLVLKFFKPRPKYVTLYDTFTDFLNMTTIFVVMFLACPSPLLAGADPQTNGVNIGNTCNNDCGCSQKVFTPICNQDLTYFSPCHAGCKDSITLDGSMIYTNCSCLFDTKEEQFTLGRALKGYCDDGCSYIIIYIIILTLGKMIICTSKVGSILVTLRCVNEKDKAFAMGATELLFSLFCFIPYPLIYGALTDESCLVWEEKCGKHGNCWIYDIDKFRYLIHGVTIVFLFLGSLCHLGVYFLSGRLKDFYGEDMTGEDNNEMKEQKLPLAN